MQRRHVPRLVLSTLERDLGGKPERSCLFLPSELGHNRRLKCCSNELINAEAVMRVAAAYEALEEVRRHIRMRATLVVFLPNNMQGYHDATRSAASFKSLWALVDGAADLYRAHRSAVITLQGIAKLSADLKQLNQKHLVPLNFYEDPATAEAIQEVIGRIVPLAQHDAPGNTGEEDAEGEADGEEPVNLNVGPGGTQLTGALNHGLQRRAVPWIWLGANLKPGENNGDPAGEFVIHSNGHLI
jgi:hypothetical protein